LIAYPPDDRLSVQYTCWCGLSIFYLLKILAIGFRHKLWQQLFNANSLRFTWRFTLVLVFLVPLNDKTQSNHGMPSEICISHTHKQIKKYNIHIHVILIRWTRLSSQFVNLKRNITLWQYSLKAATNIRVCSLTLPHFELVLSQDLAFQRHMSWTFSLCSVSYGWKVYVRFIDCSGIVDPILYPELSFLLRYTGTTILHREWVDPSLFEILFITHIKLCSSLHLLEAQSNSFYYKKYKLLNNYRITQSSSPPANLI
jgi:hypothetical protein